MIATFYIYTLLDPATDAIFYVGVTSDPKERKRNHLVKPTRARSAASAYMSKMECYPVFEIVDSITYDNGLHYARPTGPAIELESAWIDKLKTEGKPLTNTKSQSKGRLASVK